MSPPSEPQDQLDELERLVLQTARRSPAPDMPDAALAREGIRRRIAALPLTGLPNIEIPAIPSADPTTLITAASGKAAAAAAVTQALPSIPMTALVTAGQFKLAAIVSALLGATVVAPRLLPSEQARLDSVSPPTSLVEKSEAPTKTASPLIPRSNPARADAAKPQSAAPQPNATQADLVAQGPTEERSGDQSGTTGQREEPAEVSPERPEARTLNEELEQLRAAQQSLQKGDPARALQTMLDLDREASGGSLYPERQIIKVLALCALGRSAEAESLALQLSKTSGATMYTSRLKNSCVSSSTISDQ